MSTLVFRNRQILPGQDHAAIEATMRAVRELLVLAIGDGDPLDWSTFRVSTEHIPEIDRWAVDATICGGE
jgi:hypothetical protein